MPAAKKVTSSKRSHASNAKAIAPSRFKSGWQPRPYQQHVINQFDAGIRYHFYVWHRRAGKDSVSLNIAADQKDKVVGTYWHLFPLHVQARRAIWKGMDNNGLRFIDQAFPDKSKIYETDMLIEFPNGSTWQLTGSDYFDRLVGANVKGAVFSEWALCDPRAWNYIRPILRENGGWACFITTFRGRNHAFQMFNRLKDNPEWSCNILTVDDTRNNDGSRVLTEADIQAERDSGMSEAMIQQEYYCNPLAAAEGAIYGASVSKFLKSENTVAEYDPRKPVTAAWSLGYLPVNVSVVFAQNKNIIGSRSWMFETFATALTEVMHSFPWTIAEHVVMEGVDVFQDTNIYPRICIAPPDGRITQIASALIECANIDTKVRKFEPEGNNLLLVEALNGYAAKETNQSSWSLTGVSEYHYLTKAFETYAVWQSQQQSDWGKPPNYRMHDRSVI